MTESRREFLKAGGTAAAGAAAGIIGAPAVLRAQKVHKWKVQSLWNAAELTYKIFVEFTERVKRLTNGRVEITPFSGGSVVGAFETLDAVSAGVLQGQSSWPGYWTGKEPGLAVISDFVFGYTHPWQHDAWFHYKGGLELLRESYAKFNIYPVGVCWWGVEVMPSKKPIRTMADFKGVKIRAPHGMTAEILTKLGASVVVLPGGEVYSALDKGLIDATDWATPSMNYRMGFYEVTKYFNYPGFHSMPIHELAINLNAWNELDGELKAILTTAVREWAWDQVERVAIDDVEKVAEMRKKGIQPIRWDEDELRKFRALAQRTWDGWAKKSSLARRAVESQKAWLRELGLLA